MRTTEIEGANFIMADPDNWERLSAAVSSDRSRLDCIYEVADGFRVQRYVRGTMDPQFQGEWWLAQNGQSTTDTLLHAEQLATEFLQSAA